MADVVPEDQDQINQQPEDHQAQGNSMHGQENDISDHEGVQWLDDKPHQDLIGSQYSSQEEENPLDKYEDYQGYDQPFSDDEEQDELDYFALDPEEEVTLGTLVPNYNDEEDEMISRASMRRVVGTMQ